MEIYQKQIRLGPFSRGFHLITGEIYSSFRETEKIKKGFLQVFLQHTSASLTINENADPTVRQDFSSFFRRLVPDAESYFRHNYEGDDDMSAHLKSSLLGCSVMIPIFKGRLALGTWQGIYLGEHRERAGKRSLFLSAWGEIE